VGIRLCRPERPRRRSLAKAIDHQLGCRDVVKGGDRPVADPEGIMNTFKQRGQQFWWCRKAAVSKAVAAGVVKSRFG